MIVNGKKMKIEDRLEKNFAQARKYIFSHIAIFVLVGE